MNSEHYNGRNILSFEQDTPFSGSEIKSWILWHMSHDRGMKTKVAGKMKKYLTIHDDVEYCIVKNLYRSSNFDRYFVMRYRKYRRA